MTITTNIILLIALLFTASYSLAANMGQTSNSQPVQSNLDENNIGKMPFI